MNETLEMLQKIKDFCEFRGGKCLNCQFSRSVKVEDYEPLTFCSIRELADAVRDVPRKWDMDYIKAVLEHD